MVNEYSKNIGTLISQQIQQELMNKNILLIGCGGIGGYTADLIARLNVNNLILFDGDQYEISNLNRQLPSSYSNLGLNKAAILGNYLTNISSTNIFIYEHYFGEKEEDKEIFFKHQIDYIIWAADKNEHTEKALSIIESALDQKIPIFTGGIQPEGCGVMVFTEKDKNIFHDFFFGTWEIAEQISVPAYLCAVTGGFIVNEIIKFVKSGRPQMGQRIEYLAIKDKINKFDYTYGWLSGHV